MADTNVLTSGVAAPQYPTFQPIQQPNMLAQMQAATQTAQGLQNLQASQVGLQHKKLEIIHNEMGALTSIPGGPSWQDVQDRITSLTQMGVLKPEEAASALPNIPQGSGPDANLARKAFFDKQLQITGGYAGNMNAAYGAGVSRDTGAGTAYGSYNVRAPGQVQMPGATQGPGGTVAPNQPTDAAYSENVPYKNNQNQVSNLRVTPAQLQDIARGRSRVDNFGRIIPAGAAAPQTGTLPGTGGGGIAEPAPGTVEAQKATAESNIPIETAITRSQAEAPQRQADLANLQSLSKKFQTGPYAEMALNFKRGYNDLKDRIPGMSSMPGFDPDSIAAQENFVKNAGLLAQRQFASIGGTGTDAKLDSAIKTNPGQALSGMGNQEIMSMLQGNEDALKAKSTAWQNWKKDHGPGTVDQFQEDFNQNYNPRAFQWARMNPDQRAQMAADMQKNDPQAYAQLKNAVKEGTKRGWIKPGTVSAPSE